MVVTVDMLSPWVGLRIGLQPHRPLLGIYSDDDRIIVLVESGKELAANSQRRRAVASAYLHIWRRRTADPRAVLPYLAMSYPYKRSNWLWYRLIRHRLTARVWRGLVEMTRRRHLKFRQRLEEETKPLVRRSACVVSGGGVTRNVVLHCRPRTSRIDSPGAMDFATWQGLLQLIPPRGRHLGEAKVQLSQALQSGQLLEARVRHLGAAKV